MMSTIPMWTLLIDAWSVSRFSTNSGTAKMMRLLGILFYEAAHDGETPLRIPT